MDKVEYLDTRRIINTYSEKYGVSKKSIQELIDSGISHGLTLKAVEIGIRMTLGESAGGNREFFTVEDMMEVSGESREEVIKHIQEMEQNIKAVGGNPDEFIIARDTNNLS